MSADVPSPAAHLTPLPPIPAELSPLTDEELLHRIRQSAAGFRFRRLWHGHSLHHTTASAADFELCRMLASWGGPDPQRIDRLFRLSGRMAHRWDEPCGDRTYGQLTLDQALGKALSPGDPLRPLARKLELRWGDAVLARPIEWLWPDWLARGVLAVLDGDPGLGKSSVALDLVARVTTGVPFPGAAGSSAGPRRALVVALEDSVEHVVKPRLEAAGADLSRVGFIGGVMESTAHGPESYGLQLPRDLDLVAKVVREYRPALLVIDPLFAVMGLDRRGRFIRASDDQSVRRLTGELKTLAEEEALTVLLIRHLNKSRRGTAVLRGSGSVAIAGQARAVLLAAPDPEDANRRVLAMVKTNLGRLPRSLRFGVVEATTAAGPCCRVEWDGKSDLTADDLLSPPDRPAGDEDEEGGAYLLARAFLVRALADGPRTWAELVAAGKEEDLAEGTLRVARKEMKLVRSGMGPGTRWRLRDGKGDES
jgi:putative DNA primase/helicase